MIELMDKFGICSIIGVIGSGIVGALGGWDTAIQTLVIFMAIDFVMGIIAAVVFKVSKKSENGKVSSCACFKGLVRKVCTLLLVIVGHYADVLTGSEYIRNTFVIGFCTAELISIVELSTLMGIIPAPVKKVIDKVVDILHTKTGGGNNDNK